MTNHALLAIDAMHGGTALPEHNAVIIDEAHELVGPGDRGGLGRAHPGAGRAGARRRALTYLRTRSRWSCWSRPITLRRRSGRRCRWSGSRTRTRRWSPACEAVRNAARTAVSALTGGEDKADPDRRQAAAAVKEVFDVAERMAALSEHDVVWVADRERFGPRGPGGAAFGRRADARPRCSANAPWC